MYWAWHCMLFIFLSISHIIPQLLLLMNELVLSTCIDCHIFGPVYKWKPITYNWIIVEWRSWYCCWLILVMVKCYLCIRDAPPVIPTTTQHGYKQNKAKIGQSRVRPWKWMPFTNPARKVCGCTVRCSNASGIVSRSRLKKICLCTVQFM